MTQKPNLAVDMISAALAHYKQYGKQVEKIVLSHRMWRIFKEYLKERSPGIHVEDAIQFRNVLIEKGSMFQVKSLTVEFKKEAANVR